MAGSDRRGIWYEQRSYPTKILDGVAKDETYFGVIYTIDNAARLDTVIKEIAECDAAIASGKSFQ